MMALDLNKRVRRPDEDDRLISKLVSGSEAAFGSMADLLIFSAAYAYHQGLPRKPFDKTGEPIALSVFVNSQYDGFLLMLAAQSSEDYGVVIASRTDEVILIFEEYAAAGLGALEVLLSGRRPAVDVIRDLALAAFVAQNQSSDPDFDKLLSELG